jgi:hypothetical protein
VKLLGALLGLVAVTALLGACTSSSGGGASPPGSVAGDASVSSAGGGSSPTTAASGPSLDSLLVAVTEMPTGWSVYTDDTPSPLKCVNTLSNIGGDESAKAAFQQGTDGDQVSEKLIRLADEAAASATLKAADDAIAGCDGESATIEDRTVSVQAGQLSFPAAGDESLAWSASALLNGSTIAAVDYAFIRKGTIVVLASDVAGYSSPDIDEFQSWVSRAYAKLP